MSRLSPPRLTDTERLMPIDYQTVLTIGIHLTDTESLARLYHVVSSVGAGSGA